MVIPALTHSGEYDKTTSGAKILVPNNPSADQNVIIYVDVWDSFANGSGGQSTFSIGQTGSASKFAATSAFTGLAAGSRRYFAGILSAGDDLIVTGAAATGTGTGGINVHASVVPLTE